MLGQSSLLASMMAAPSGLRPQDVFATSLYTGNGSARSIANGINLSGEGGLTWIKSRSAGSHHRLWDTARGINKELSSSTTNYEASRGSSLTAFNANGFSLGTDAGVNEGAGEFAAWTFRKAPKFFDVVTYTGTGSTRTVSHNLGSVPGMVIVKGRSAGTDGYSWTVWHNSFPGTDYIFLNSTGAKATGTTTWNSTAPTSSVFSLGSSDGVNTNGETYVAYLFAHDTDTSGIVQCGSFVSDGTGAGAVTLGWKPQFVMLKVSSMSSSWAMLDTGRGINNAGNDALLVSNFSAAEYVGLDPLALNSTGFTMAGNFFGYPSATHIYLAIREPV